MPLNIEQEGRRHLRLDAPVSRIIRHLPICASEWAHVEPLIPPAKRGGGKRRADMRAVVNGVMYVLSTGCQWSFRRAAP